MKQQKILNYNLIFRKEPEGGYTVTVPALPGCITYGKTIEEARDMAQEAILLYIESLKKHREPVPSDDTILITTLSVHLPDSKKKTNA